jgi:hypothetical protein
VREDKEDETPHATEEECVTRKKRSIRR